MKRVILLVIVLVTAVLVSANPVNTLFESFDSQNSMPTGWTTIIESQSTASNVWVQTSEYDAYSGTNFVKMHGDVEANQDYLMLVTPELTQLSTNQLSFYSKSSWGEAVDSVRVGTMSDPSDRDTYTELAVFQVTNQYQEFTLDFPADNSDSYIAFLHMPLGEVDYAIYIDDVSWESATSIPNSANIVSPLDGASDVILTYQDHVMQFPLIWTSNGGNPTEYILNVGSDYPPTNVINNLSLGNVTESVSYRHVRAHETSLEIVCRLLGEKKN
jgi:hypothetical protein